MSLSEALGVPEDSLVKGSHFLDQPSSAEGSTSELLTYRWCATLCPPELNDLALAESVVYEMRMAAHREIARNKERPQPTLKQVLESDENATIYESTFEVLRVHDRLPSTLPLSPPIPARA